MNTTEPRKRKRKACASGDKDLDTKADRKRVQNRISQQCLREKQLARTRHLESVMQLVKSNATTTGQGNSAAAMEAQFKLIAENERLRDALFRMKKKLLSLSHMAATAAEDEIFGALLHGSGPESSSLQSEEAPAAPSDPDVAAEHAPPPVVMNTTCATTGTEGISGTQPTFDDTHFESGDLSLWGSTAFDDHSDYNLTACVTSTNSGIDYGSLGLNLFDEANDCSSRVGDPVQTHDHLSVASFAQGPYSPLRDPTEGLPQHRPAALTDKIVKACLKYHRLVNSASHINKQRYNVLAPGVSAGPDPTKMLAVTALHLMTSFTGFQPYVYGVNAAAPIESILRWRITNSVEDRLAIPEPFRPTPLQYSRADHCPAIDMVNWPSIRDQLIIKSFSIDLDSMIKDVVLHTVIEDPSREVSMNVYDVFYNKVLPLCTSHMGLGRQIDESHHPLDDPLSPDTRSSVIDLLAESAEIEIFREVSHRMRLGSSEHEGDKSKDQLTQPIPSSSASTSARFRLCKVPQALGTPQNPTSHQLSASSAFYGLNKPNNWKLSSAFARKYPFLDCSQVVARYEMVPCSQIAGF